MDLQSILNTVLKTGVENTISNKTGLDKDQVSQVIAAGLPMILGGLAKNTDTKEGADALDAAVTKDHSDTSPLEDSEKAAAAADEKDGEGILGHVFGGSGGNIFDLIASKTGSDSDTVKKVLAMLAPLVLVYLAQHKKQNDLDSEGVSDSLKKTTTPSGTPVKDILSGILGKDTGNLIDDVLGSFTKKQG